MTRHLFAGFAWSIIFCWSVAATALPAPKSDSEMMKEADLVVDASCASIVCQGKPVDTGTKIVTTYRSTLWPSKSYKGGLPNSFVIRGEQWKYKGPPPTGGWHQGAVPKGWAGKLYLKQLPDKTYTKVWWNATTEDKAKSKPLTLPSCAAADGGVADALPSPDAAPAPDMPVPDFAPKPDDPMKPDYSPPKGDDPAPKDSQGKQDTGPEASVSPDGGAAPPEDDSGCAMAGAPNPSAGLWLLLGALLYRRRR